MPTIEFEISATGEMKSAVRGIPGPACDDIAKLIKELGGGPTTESKTKDWSVKPVTVGRVKR